MINGQWFMAHGPRMARGPGRSPNARGRAAIREPWAMKHWPLTIIDWLMHHSNYSIIYYRYYVSGGLQFELNSKQFGKNDPSNSKQFNFHNKFTVKMTKIQTHWIRIPIRIPLPRDPPSKLLIQRPSISPNRKLGPQSLGIQNHVPMVIWASIDERSYCVPSTIIPSTWIEHQSWWLSAFQLLRHDSSHNWMDTHAWVAL